MLVFDYLVERQTDPQVQIALIAGKLEDIFATVFRQNVLTRFEEAAFAARKERRLTPELLGTLWSEANGKYYGDAVEMPEGYRGGWSYIPPSSIPASTATVTSSASYWSWRFIECTVKQAKASCQNTLLFWRPAAPTVPKLFSIRWA